MRTILTLAIMISSCIGINAQLLENNQLDKNNRSVTYFYVVHFDQDLLNLFDSTDPNNIINKTYHKTTKNGFVVDVIDTFYSIAAETFKNNLNIELLPLNELQGKIKYSNTYPECPYISDVKKVIKDASGYQYYIDFYINVLADNAESYYTLPITRIRPVYLINFTLYNNQGEKIKVVQLNYKPKNMLFTEKDKAYNTAQVMKSRLCNYYCEALNELTSIYKNNDMAQL